MYLSKQVCARPDSGRADTFAVQGSAESTRVPQMRRITTALAVLTGAASARDEPQGMTQIGNRHGGGFREACATDMQTYCASAQSREDHRQCVQKNTINYLIPERRLSTGINITTTASRLNRNVTTRALKIRIVINKALA